MAPDRDYLNRRIRERIETLSDEELVAMTRSSEYTPFARREAGNVLERRRQPGRRLPGIAGKLPPSDRNRNSRAAPDCYIEIWTKTKFRGEHLRVEGPAEHDDLILSSVNWGDDVASLRIGPNAFVLAYEDKGYKGRMLAFGPNDEVPDLGRYRFADKMDSFQIINSMKIFERVYMDQEGRSAGFAGQERAPAADEATGVRASARKRERRKRKKKR